MNNNFLIKGLMDLSIKNVQQKKQVNLNKKVYVGNIPYNTSEQEIKEILQIVGPIVHFQFNLNKETGKQKGFGFCEYVDHDTAESAVRNLNGYEYQNRNLKVHFPDKIDDAPNFVIEQNSQDFDVQLFEENNKNKNFNEVLFSLDINQKYFIMLQLKDIIDNNPREIEELLKNSPQTCQMILKLQQDLNMDKPLQNFPYL